jgi:hypothetical protein
VVHELFGIGDRGINKPDIEHQEEAKEKEEFPAPFLLQITDRVLLLQEMVHKKDEKRHDSNLDRDPGKSTIPGQDREDQYGA